MSRTLIGIVSYSGLPFLELAVRSIQETAKSEVGIRVITAKPGDTEMSTWLFVRGIPQKIHTENRGFPASVNDLLDAAFVGDGVSDGNYDQIILMGNDVVAMPGAIDAMIRTADESEYEMVCGSEFDSRFLVANYPEARQFFHGENNTFTDFGSRPWEMHKDFREGIEPDTRKDIRNFTLFKRSAFEKSGYADVGFFCNGYYEDLDACRRMDKLGVKACGLKEAAFFHFWSRSIHQNVSRDHNKFYRQNAWLYHEKWGGDWGTEKYDLPYHGDPFQLAPGLILPPALKISTRDQEDAIIEYWRNL